MALLGSDLYAAGMFTRAGNKQSYEIAIWHNAANSAQPALTIVQDGGNAVVQWLTGYTGFALETTTNLGLPSSWVPVSETQNGDENTATTPVSGAQFFRLRK